MRAKFMIGAALIAISATPALAQTVPTVSGTATGGTSTTTTTNVGSPSTETTGDSTTPPYQNTTTTTQNQTVTNSTTGNTVSGSVTFAGVSHGYTITASGAGSQGQVSSSSITTTYNPGPPPSVISTTAPVTTTTAVGSPTITSVSASSAVNTNSSGYVTYASNLSTSGTPSAAGSVTATENVIGVTTSGATFATYVGTATYNPTNGNVVVALPSTPTSSTSVTSSGVSTTGNLSAGAVTVNGSTGRITGLTAGVANSDAVNVGQMNTAISTAIAGVNSSISSLSSLVEANRKRSDAGIATAVALSGGTFLPDKKFNLTANIGAFRDEVAIAGQLGILVNENVALNAGVATSFHSYGGTAVRGGVTFGF